MTNRDKWKQWDQEIKREIAMPDIEPGMHGLDSYPARIDQPITREQLEQKIVQALTTITLDFGNPRQVIDACRVAVGGAVWPIIERLQQENEKLREQNDGLYQAVQLVGKERTEKAERVAKLERLARGMYEIINDLPHKWSRAFKLATRRGGVG